MKRDTIIKIALVVAGLAALGYCVYTGYRLGQREVRHLTILHVNGAFPTAVSTEFPAAVSALVLGEVDAQGFVDQLQLAIDMAE